MTHVLAAVVVMVVGVVTGCADGPGRSFCDGVREGESLPNVISAAESATLAVHEDSNGAIIVYGWDVEDGQCLIIFDNRKVVAKEFTKLD